MRMVVQGRKVHLGGKEEVRLEAGGREKSQGEGRVPVSPSVQGSLGFLPRVPGPDCHPFRLEIAERLLVMKFLQSK